MQLVVGKVARHLAAPSLTVTVPVGDPLLAVTVNATEYACPVTVAVVRFVVIVVVVFSFAAGFTVCATPGDTLPLKFVSPL